MRSYVITKLTLATDTFIFLIETVPPHIIGDGIKDLTVKKGRPIRYDLWFGGEPAPSVEWIRDGRTLGTDENMSIELYSKNTIYTERNTVLNIPKVIKKNSWDSILINRYETQTH